MLLRDLGNENTAGLEGMESSHISEAVPLSLLFPWGLQPQPLRLTRARQRSRALAVLHMQLEHSSTQVPKGGKFIVT